MLILHYTSIYEPGSDTRFTALTETMPLKDIATNANPPQTNTSNDALTTTCSNTEDIQITIDNKPLQTDIFTDTLLDEPSFWNGYHGTTAIKIILINLIAITMLNLTLWLRLAEWRRIIILFPLTEIIDYLHHEEMNFFLMVALFGFTIFGIYVTLENIKNIQDNVCILRTVSIVLLICPIFGFRTPFWIFIFVPFYGTLDSAVYKYMTRNKKLKRDDTITMIAIHHYIVHTLAKYRGKETVYAEHMPWRRMEYERLNAYLDDKLEGNGANNFTEASDVMTHMERTFRWKRVLSYVVLTAFIVCSEISLFRFLRLKRICVDYNDWLFWFYASESVYNFGFAACVLIWSFSSKLNRVRKDRMLQITQRYSWSDGYFLLDGDEFTETRYETEFDAFYNKWAMSYWHRDVTKIFREQQYVNSDVLCVIFEFV